MASPHSFGTSSQARLKTDGRNDPNYKLVEEDLKSTQRVDFANMLKALIMMKRVREDNASDDAPLSSEELDAYGIEQTNSLIEESVKFCNDGKRSQKVKEKLGEVLKSRDEASRYAPLVAALNSIVLDFSKRDVGTIERCASHDETLYTINDPFIIESERLSAITSRGTISKPDICEVPLEKLLNVVALEGLKEEDQTLQGLAKFMETQSEAWIEARKKSDSKLTWSDVVHCLEVKCSSSKTLPASPQRFSEPYTASTMTVSAPRLSSDSGSSSAGPASHSDAPRTKGKKRAAETLADDPLPKRAKSQASNVFSSQQADSSDKEHKPYLKPDIQCAFYGIELLRATWDKTHSIVTLLNDNNLSLHWYDAQGSIKTNAIDIVEQLPLLVAMTVLFQRFKKPMRGIAGIDLKMPLNGEQVEFSVPADADLRWEFKGRRPVTCIPLAATRPPAQRTTRATQASSDEQCAIIEKQVGEHYFKWSWRENTRDAEADIIATAKARAEQYLGDHKDDVINHLPEVKYAQDYDSLSTGHIRKYAGLDTTKSRLPHMLISTRLTDVTELDGEALKGKIWEVLRCIVLLWRIGIAHSDVSLGNIMVKNTEQHKQYLVLNDFDLATVMNPGDQSPSKKGFERTGTKPFMAVELLRSSSGNVRRLCRHDLESVIWVVVWLCYRNISWYYESFYVVFMRKASYIDWAIPNQLPEDIDEKYVNLWKPVTFTVAQWMRQWGEANMGQTLENFTDDHVLDAIQTQFPCPEEYLTWDWRHFKVDL